ncbi:hypothetical protein GCM10027605_70200 [Micromonospora zhanjiangensis]
MTAPSEKPGGGVPAVAPPVGANTGAPAEFPPASKAGRGMFGVHGSGDTSGFGGLARHRVGVEDTPGRTAGTSTRSATRWRRRTRPSPTPSRRWSSTGTN